LIASFLGWLPLRDFVFGTAECGVPAKSAITSAGSSATSASKEEEEEDRKAGSLAVEAAAAVAPTAAKPAGLES
jgi:hypothetical protein